jgi:phosphatidylglycerophosphatase A
MAIKESSDELNPSVVVGASLPQKSTAHSPSDYLALAIATCGVGYFPIAPGTFGSLIGVIVYLVLAGMVSRFDSFLGNVANLIFFSPHSLLLAVELILITVITLTGIWAATRVERLSGRKDPGKVVIDEVAGQMVALLPVLYGSRASWISILSAFILFRLFDIIKPYPAGRLESLEAGLGIMADDIVAGAYAAVGVSVIAALRPFI